MAFNITDLQEEIVSAVETLNTLKQSKKVRENQLAAINLRLAKGQKKLRALRDIKTMYTTYTQEGEI